jgi:hypothetical protein
METKTLYSWEDSLDSISTTATLRDGMLIVKNKGAINNPAKVRYKTDNKFIVLPDGVAKMCVIMKVGNDKLLTELGNRFSNKTSYDDMLGFLYDHHIPFTDKFPLPENIPITTPVTLYYLKEKTKEINVTATFEYDNLLISKYHDEREYFKHYGLSDHTWVDTVKPSALEKLYDLFDLPQHDRQGILAVLASKFNSPECHTEIEKFLKENEIEFDEGAGPISWF